MSNSKETFVWTDELVSEFTTWSLTKAPVFQGRFADIEQFKQTKMPPKKEWEIESYNYAGNIYNRNGGYFFNRLNISSLIEDQLKDLNAKINSVKRLSDNEVFTVGQDVNYGTIEKFYIGWAGMEVHFTNGNGATLASIEKLPPQSKPEQSKRIEIVYMNESNVLGVSKSSFGYSFLSTNYIPVDKFPSIKAAIERVLNYEDGDDSYEGQTREELIHIIHFWRNNNQGNYDKWKEANYKLREAEEKAFNGAIELLELSMKFPSFQDYVTHKSNTTK